MESRARLRNGESKTSFDDLPSEMASNIFSRLPVKSLIRSSSVSKTWYSLILNPSFIASQITNSLSSCDENAVLIIPTHTSYQNYCTLVSAQTGHVSDNYEIPFKTKSGTLRLVGSVHGLLCVTELFASGPPIDLYLWNPSIRKYKAIVSTCLSDLYSNWQKRSYVVGFGYHEPTRDFRVVRIASCVDDEGNEVAEVGPKAEVFSLRMNKWREIENPILPRAATFKSSTTVDSTMYGLSTYSPKTYTEEVWVLWFDFNKEVFGQLKLPDDVRYCLGEMSYFSLMKFEGSLSVCVFKITGSGDIRTQPFCIWLMRNQDGIISWTKQVSVVLKELGIPLNFVKSGALIMMSCPLTSPFRSIISCNLKSMQHKSLGFDNSLDEKIKLPATVDTSFIESLVMHGGRRSFNLLKSAS